MVQLSALLTHTFILSDFAMEAVYDVSNRGSRHLIVMGFRFSVDRVLIKSTNWRCASGHKSKCRARAITKMMFGKEMVKITNGIHTHPPDDLAWRDGWSAFNPLYE